MGRVKVDTGKKAQGDCARHVAFSKRRSGLMKKAFELSVLCGVEIAVVVFSEKGKVYSFAHPEMSYMLAKHHNPRDARSFSKLKLQNIGNRLELKVRHHDEVANQFKLEQERNSSLKTMKARVNQKWWRQLNLQGSMTIEQLLDVSDDLQKLLDHHKEFASRVVHMGLQQPAMVDMGLQPAMADMGLQPAMADMGPQPAMADLGLQPANPYQQPAMANMADLDDLDDLADLADLGLQPAMADMGLQQPAMAHMGLQQPAMADIGLQQPAMADIGLQQPAMADIGLQQPAMADIGLQPAMADMGLQQPAMADLGLQPTMADMGLQHPAMTDMGLQLWLLHPNGSGYTRYFAPDWSAHTRLAIPNHGNCYPLTQALCRNTSTWPGG